ncbi:islet cell autoantigen 1 isoform X2 [Anabrus simplex]|uniref:islet cell autoantigen 1 isoform X2 n=1 Tax=Anabrus simplex TaxID=316456 RepID=UPI0034DD13F6
MNAYRTSGGYSGTAYDRWVEQRGSDNPNKSTITKMQHHYWVTKQTVFRKLGKKEDECIVASDAELDAKLELFRSIQESCMDLQRIIDKYQERLCNLAQEENSMGRFLKEAGKNDKTCAGKMMTAVGKSLSYSGQQRLTLRVPLLRLYQEVETFRHRAIEDTLQNVNSMEKVRTEYRASLSWMKNVSQELDPDTYKQLERFRKVQGQVRRSKLRFDQLKLDCLQKVDLLAAARCNMFSHALILYQNSLLQFAEKTANTFTTISNSFKGYQHYEFSIVKELTEPSLKLAEMTSQGEEEGDKAASTEDQDKLLFFEAEYHDTVEDDTSKKNEETSEGQTKSESLENLFPTEPVLLDLGAEPPPLTTSDIKMADQDLLLLDEILHAETNSSSFGTEWDAVFGCTKKEDEGETFLPSRLLDQFAALSLPDPVPEPAASPMPTSATPTGVKDKGQEKRAAWFNLFADLDPLADPDALGRKAGEDDRHC